MMRLYVSWASTYLRLGGERAREAEHQRRRVHQLVGAPEAVLGRGVRLVVERLLALLPEGARGGAIVVGLGGAGRAVDTTCLQQARKRWRKRRCWIAFAFQYRAEGLSSTTPLPGRARKARERQAPHMRVQCPAGGRGAIFWMTAGPGGMRATLQRMERAIPGSTAFLRRMGRTIRSTTACLQWMKGFIHPMTDRIRKGKAAGAKKNRKIDRGRGKSTPRRSP